jgi:hypothetical protein
VFAGLPDPTKRDEMILANRLRSKEENLVVVIKGSFPDGENNVAEVFRPP